MVDSLWSAIKYAGSVIPSGGNYGSVTSAKDLEELLQEEAPKPKMDSEGVRLLPDGSDGQPLDPADALETCVSSSREGGGEGGLGPALTPRRWSQARKRAAGSHRPRAHR